MIMNPKRSLFLKILLWFLMSLVLLIGLVAGIFNLDFRFRAESALISGLGGQGKALGQVILRELYDSDYYEWGSILKRTRPRALSTASSAPTRKASFHLPSANLGPHPLLGLRVVSLSRKSRKTAGEPLPFGHFPVHHRERALF